MVGLGRRLYWAGGDRGVRYEAAGASMFDLGVAVGIEIMWETVGGGEQWIGAVRDGGGE